MTFTLPQAEVVEELEAVRPPGLESTSEVLVHAHFSRLSNNDRLSPFPNDKLNWFHFLNGETNTMSVYYGTIKGNTIVLPREVKLTDGLTVQIRVWPLQRPVTSQTPSETLFKQKLLELGLLSDLKNPSSSLEETPLVQVRGKPLSEMIIEERR